MIDFMQFDKCITGSYRESEVVPFAELFKIHQANIKEHKRQECILKKWSKNPDFKTVTTFETKWKQRFTVLSRRAGRHNVEGIIDYISDLAQDVSDVRLAIARLEEMGIDPNAQRHIISESSYAITTSAIQFLGAFQMARRPEGYRVCCQDKESTEFHISDPEKWRPSLTLCGSPWNWQYHHKNRRTVPTCLICVKRFDDITLERRLRRMLKTPAD